MPSFYMILHSKIWQRLRGDLDNSRDKEQSQVINDSQAYSPVLTVLLAERSNGKQRGEPQYKLSEMITDEKTSFQNLFTNAWNYLLLKFYQAKYLRGTKEFLSASKQVEKKQGKYATHRHC